MKTYLVFGYGSMGKIIVKDLFETTKDSIIVAGRNLKAAKDAAKSFKSKRVSARYADVNDINSMVKAFKNADVVIHAVHHEYNANVMKACLKAKCSYVDLGGLYHWIKGQLKLHNKFRKAGLTAVIGMGAAPGITDVLASYAGNLLDRVDSVDVKLGSLDKTKVIRASPLSSSYSIETIFQEFSYKPAVLVNGRVRFVEPMSGVEEYRFPEPVGMQKPMYTIHSEVATIPLALRNKGIKNCSFKIAFDDDFVRKVRFLQDLGLASEEPIEVKGMKVKPKDVLVKILKSLPQPKLGKPKGYEVIRAVVNGRLKGKSKMLFIDCRTTGMPKWDIGLDIDTGSPASIAAQMIANKIIRYAGVYVAGIAVPHRLFFKELRKRNMKVYLNNRLIN